MSVVVFQGNSKLISILWLVGFRVLKDCYKGCTQNFFAVLSVILFLCASPAMADRLDEGITARESGDYRKAIRILKPLATKGNSVAQYHFGEMLRKGQGIPQNYKYALSYYRKAAKQNYSDAEYKIGLIYREGLGVPVNEARAFYWWKKAASHGNVDAQMNLGFIYFKGKGVKQSFVMAYAWSAVAASQKYMAAKSNQNIVAGLMTSSEIREAKRLAKSYWKKFVEPYQTGSYFRRHKLKL